MSEEHIILTKGLWKNFGEKTAVRRLDLSIYEKEVFGLLGVNGAGKTTLIKMLCRMLTPTEGEILIKGKLMEDYEAKKMINLSPQETAVALNLTVLENLELMTGLYGIPSEKARINIAKVMEEFNLQEVAGSKAKTLSGGWQRRLSIAMAMVTEPEILFLDEPTLGLDVIARRELWQTIKEIKKRTTIVLTTHYLEEAENLCDRIGIMAKGSLRGVGTAEEIKTMAGCDRFEDAFIELAGGKRRD